MIQANDCIECGKCTSNCIFLEKYKMNLKEFSQNEKLAYHCFLCGTCKEVCPKSIDGKKIAVAMRETQIKNGLEKNIKRQYKGLLFEKNRYKFSNYKKAKKSAVFWGCNFPAFFPDTTKRLECIMEEHGIGSIYDCCGKPVQELGLAHDASEIIQVINDRLEKNEVEELIVVCPNCYYFLRNKLKVRFVTIYDKLNELNIGNILNQKYIGMYYPCPDREEKIFAASLEHFVSGSICDEYANVQCCGLGGCAGKNEVELADKMSTMVLEMKRPLYTYCASCISNFKRKGMTHAYHMLPLILGIEEEFPRGIAPVIHRMKHRIR